MKITINVKKKHMYILVAVLGIGFSSIIAFSGPTPSPGHPLSDVIVDSNLNMQGHDICMDSCRSTWPQDTRCSSSGNCQQLCIGSDCIDSWSQVGGGCTWSGWKPQCQCSPAPNCCGSISACNQATTLKCENGQITDVKECCVECI